MELSVRSGLQVDEAEVAQLWRDCGLTASYNDPGADFRFACAGPASDVLLGVEKDRIVGSVMVGHDGHRGWIYYLACVPDRRKLGIGRRMVEAAEAWLRERGVVKLHLMLRETNVGVSGFYERMGYEPMRRALMAKWL